MGFFKKFTDRTRLRTDPFHGSQLLLFHGTTFLPPIIKLLSLQAITSQHLQDLSMGDDTIEFSKPALHCLSKKNNEVLQRQLIFFRYQHQIARYNSQPGLIEFFASWQLDGETEFLH